LARLKTILASFLRPSTFSSLKKAGPARNMIVTKLEDALKELKAQKESESAPLCSYAHFLAGQRLDAVVKVVGRDVSACMQRDTIAQPCIVDGCRRAAHHLCFNALFHKHPVDIDGVRQIYCLECGLARLKPSSGVSAAHAQELDRILSRANKRRGDTTAQQAAEAQPRAQRSKTRRGGGGGSGGGSGGGISGDRPPYRIPKRARQGEAQAEAQAAQHAEEAADGGDAPVEQRRKSPRKSPRGPPAAQEGAEPAEGGAAGAAQAGQDEVAPAVDVADVAAAAAGQEDGAPAFDAADVDPVADERLKEALALLEFEWTIQRSFGTMNNGFRVAAAARDVLTGLDHMAAALRERRHNPTFISLLPDVQEHTKDGGGEDVMYDIFIGRIIRLLVTHLGGAAIGGSGAFSEHSLQAHVYDPVAQLKPTAWGQLQVLWSKLLAYVVEVAKKAVHGAQLAYQTDRAAYARRLERRKELEQKAEAAAAAAAKRPARVERARKEPQRVRRRGRACAHWLPQTMSLNAMLESIKMLAQWSPISPPILDKRPGLTPFRTDSIVMLQPNMYECGISALMFASGSESCQLGIDLNKWPAKYPPIYVSFMELNEELKHSTGGGQALRLIQAKVNAEEMFLADTGIYIAHVRFIDEQDREDLREGFSHKNHTDHYVTWNADRRILYLNPGIVVVEPEKDDLSSHAGVAAWMDMVLEEHGMQFAPRHNRSRIRSLQLLYNSPMRSFTAYSCLHSLPLLD
jgi:hypothetical protein